MRNSFLKLHSPLAVRPLARSGAHAAWTARLPDPQEGGPAHVSQRL